MRKAGRKPRLFFEEKASDVLKKIAKRIFFAIILV